MIRAECHSDDQNIKVEFDATRWFEEATDNAVASLAQCGWRGDYPADDVAHSEAERNERVAFMFQYLEAIRDDPSKKDQSGFECSVSRQDAMGWLRANKPRLAKLVERVEEDPAAYDCTTGTFAPGSDSRICLTTIDVQGQEQEVFEVYADDDKTMTLGFVYDEQNARKLLEAIGK